MKPQACISNAVIRENQPVMTVTEARLFVACLRAVTLSAGELQEIRVRMVPDVISSYSGQAYSLVRDAIESLKGRKYEAAGGESLFATLEIEDQTGDVVGAWNPAVREHLTDYKANDVTYTTLDWQDKRFKNAHTYRLLWLLKSYQSLHTPKVWKVEELRLAILNDLTTYPNLADFRRGLLDKVCAELGYGYETKKRGKRVTGIVFKALPVRNPAQVAIDFKEPVVTPKKTQKEAPGKTLEIGAEWSDSDKPIVAQKCSVLQKRGLTVPQVMQILSWCGGSVAKFDKVTKAAHGAYCETQTNGGITNVAAYIVARIKKDCPGIF
ncbi:replication initiation protein [Hymenobacter aerilatus]|uniref:Replication initiation protein n=1 Tax=Hymenobacter aerilatus TaxID=2932251 RepID=A0A8T9T1G2_9BACT|nr:replication initiation protein [Hymenobacter aerilatus]UOR05849.1 replication initiation protein [Hymenobacter aerilatus]